ncbi:GIY-YIG nuclease family protein [Massilibacterium senegalense]|uniref:GIY-YIG nuclease family protein n=1 Tax=Massilibacterium senegalense TaxID=1632858 RepID=UPI0007828102|nr:GIY-YIG nuclease family protein [Massilibacterium senegalense]
MNYYVYILQCADDTFYIGYTTNIKRRVMCHQQKKGAKYTRGRTPVKLMYFQTFLTKSEALRAECALKKLSRKQKEQLIKQGV